jgi:surface antigen
MMIRNIHRTLRTLLAAMLVLLLATPAYATPPPWAPAHGYRNKHRDYYDYPPILPWHGHGYKNEYLRGGRCDRASLGAVLGGVVGGMAGSQIGKGSGRTAATIAGTVIGILVGRSIGQHMDALDQQCTGQTLEHAPDHATVRWQDPDNGTSYMVTPVRTFRHADGRYCREYTTTAAIGGRSQQLYGQACRQPDGSWVRR